ncbi:MULTISPECIES: hypothetical protein [Aliagarivorans]|uniref:hypothetical protein n=1 Tax=Aliagarivorans TaxID=882379 RepID=UPI00041D813E|nr:MULTISPECIES: hypothetical protein [Aliagarivorans]
MISSEFFSPGSQLCKAIRYISDHHCDDIRSLNDVAFRFDLNPRDQQFIIEKFCKKRATRPAIDDPDLK